MALLSKIKGYEIMTPELTKVAIISIGVFTTLSFVLMLIKDLKE